MKKILFLLLFLLSVCASAQQLTPDTLIYSEIKELKQEVLLLRKDKSKLQNEIRLQSIKIDSLFSHFKSISKSIAKSNGELDLKIKESGLSNEKKITTINESLSASISKNTLYWIIAVLLTTLLTGVLFFFLTRRQKSYKLSIEEQIIRTKDSLLQEGINLDTKLIEILDKQLKLIQEERTNNLNLKHQIDIDHSFPLKVADEITKINGYANTLDPKSQDSRALKASIKSLTNTMKSIKYEVVDMLGQRYDDGLKVIVLNAVPDEKLKPGEEVISRIIKPLVKYNGEQIQAAQVDISVGQ